MSPLETALTCADGGLDPARSGGENHWKGAETDGLMGLMKESDRQMKYCTGSM